MSRRSRAKRRMWSDSRPALRGRSRPWDARVPTGAFGMPSGEVMPSAGSGETFMRACAWAAPQPNSTAAAAIAKRVISMLLVLVHQSTQASETRVDGMASIGFRYAAYAHVSVADRLEHLKPVALRNLIECREIVIQLPDEFFRLHGLCQLREPFEVGKQNRCCIIEAGCDPIAALKF